MKTYSNCPLKRSIQRFMWKGLPIKTKRILALSGPDQEWDYLNALPGDYICDKNVTFVNYKFNSVIPCWSKSIENSLIGAFDMMVHENKIPFFIDADFCKSIIGSGDDLIYLYNKCNKLNRNIYISFTFSIRGVGLQQSFDWLRDNFPLNINDNSWLSKDNEFFMESLHHKLQYREFAYYYGDVIHYRESGDQMITGVIKINKKQ